MRRYRHRLRLRRKSILQDPWTFSFTSKDGPGRHAMALNIILSGVWRHPFLVYISLIAL